MISGLKVALPSARSPKESIYRVEMVPNLTGVE